MTRRTAASITMDRSALLGAFGDQWMRAPSWAMPSDLAALVKQGALERQVRKEWDRQRMTFGSQSGMFGGAGSCIRHRAYYRRAVTTVTEGSDNNAGKVEA